MMEDDTNNLNASLILGLSRLVNVVGRAVESFNAFFSTVPRRRSSRMRKKHKGRWKTRGGRDQDRWRGQRGEWTRRRKADRDHRQLLSFYCRFSPLRDCFKGSIAGMLTLSANPDCDFVKGGE